MIYLSVSDLSKKYNRKTVFDKVHFEHNSGILGISGANGSGKSTLLKCLSGLLRPNTGNISWKKDGKILSKTEVKPLIGYAAPYISLYEELTVLENLTFLAEVSLNKYESNYFHKLMVKTNIDHFSSKLYKSLSTGQQQRVKLASSLIKEPEILFWDEPSSNLDEKGHQLVKQIINSKKEKGTLIIIASNDPNEIALCDEVIPLSV